MSAPSLQRLLAPRSLALIGGTWADAVAAASRVIGYSGELWRVNPHRAAGDRAHYYASVDELPAAPDAAFIAAPNREVPGIAAALARRGAGGFVCFAAGFSETATPEGQRLTRELLASAGELPFLGPNCYGFINFFDGAALWPDLVVGARRECGVALICQSGTLALDLLFNDRSLPIGCVLTVGNQTRLAAEDLIELLADDARVTAIGLYLEGIRDGARFARAVARARAGRKPIALIKAGRTEAASRTVRTHTGALAGADAAVDAYFRDCGIVRVDLLETLVEIAPLLRGRRPPDLVRPGRVAVVTTTGGGAATVVDRLGLAGIETVGPRPDVPIHDLTMTATPRVYQETLEKLHQSSQCDAVLATVGSSAQFHPGLAIEPILAASAKQGAKPLAVFLTPHAERSLSLLAQRGIAAFRTPEACADAFSAYFSWVSPRNPPQLPVPLLLQDAFELVEALGIPSAPRAVAHAPGYAHSIPYPVAVKVLDAGHKTEVGGVALDVSTQTDFLKVVAAWGKKAVLVQKMERGLAEAIVGYRDDPVVGPLILVGAGGTLAELYRDFSLALAPVTAEEAERMIERVKGLAIIRGYRNLPRGDVKALARAVSDFSRLALVPERPVAEAEINPLIVKADAVVAVDARLVLKG